MKNFLFLPQNHINPNPKNQMENTAQPRIDAPEVISCTFKKNWEKQDGDRLIKKPIYDIKFSDGRAGESFNEEIPVGTSAANCTISESPYGLKIKLNKRKIFGADDVAKKFLPKNYKADFISFAASYSKDIIVGGQAPLKDFAKTFDTIYAKMESKLNEINSQSAPANGSEPKN